MNRTEREYDTVVMAEARTREMFKKDAYGAWPPLSLKRESRQWHAANTKILTADIDMPLRDRIGDLLAWVGEPDGPFIYPYALPWSAR